MVGHPEADPAAVDEVLPDRVAPFGLTLEKKVNRINKDVFLRQYREFKYLYNSEKLLMDYLF